MFYPVASNSYIMKYFSLLFLLLSIKISAQNNFSIKGKVIDNNKLPVFASVRLIKDTKIISYTITDDQGNFELKNIKSGTYRFNISSMGYKDYNLSIHLNSDINLNEIKLQTDTKILNDVVIKIYKRVIKPTNKGIILQVAGTEMANKQATTEILQIAPSVSLQNGLEILGDRHIKLTLNGQEVPISEDKVLDFINKIKPRNIKKIEIIDNGNASFEGEQSAQINIYTKNITGINGGAAITVSNNKYWGNHEEFMINSMKNKWQYFLYIDNAFHISEINDTITQNIDNDLSHYILKNQKLDRVTQGITANIGYQLDNLKHIFFLYDYNANNDENLLKHSIDKVSTPLVLDSIIKTKANLERLYHTHTLSLGYSQILDTLHSTLKLNASMAFTDYKIPQTEQQDFYRNNILSASDIYNNNKIYSNIISGIKADWDKYLNKNTELIIGGKWSQIDIDDQIDYHYQGTDGNMHQKLKFLFRQNIGALYTNVSFVWNKYQVSSGLRSEFTNTDFGKNDINENNRQYLRLLPNLKISRKFTKIHYIYISFARKLNRPSFYLFNPEEIIYNKNNRFVGNPDLLPIDIYRFQAGYYYNRQYAFNFRYDYQLDNIIFTEQYNDAGGYLLKHPVNSGERINAVIDISFPIQTFQWWKIYNKLSGAYSDYHTTLYPDNDFSSYYYYFNSSNRFRFKRINMSLNLNYMSERKHLNTTYQPVFSINWDLNYITANKKWQFYLGINDLFNTARSEYQSIYDNIIIDTYSKYLTREIIFGITYMFRSGNKIQKTKTDDILKEEKNRSSR